MCNILIYIYIYNPALRGGIEKCCIKKHNEVQMEVGFAGPLIMFI